MRDYGALFEFITISFWRELCEEGNLHISLDVFLQTRDNVNHLVGSINNWLENEPPKTHSEISNAITGIWDSLELAKQHNPNDQFLLAFSSAILDHRIGVTHNKGNGSFCVNAYLAYVVYNYMLATICRNYNIPMTERDMPLYPVFDSWLEDGFYGRKVVYKKKTNPSSSVTRRKRLSSIRHKSKVNAQFADSLRTRVLSCCEVCRLLDESSRGEV